MDANGTRFHLLLGAGDWAGVEGDGVYDSERGDYRLRALPFRFRPRVERPPLTPDARRGAAADRYGNWYWIDDARAGVVVRSSGDQSVTRFWPVPSERVATGPFVGAAPPDVPLRLSGATVTSDHYLLVGLAPEGPHSGGLLAFDLRGGGAPETWRWPDDCPFAPFDLAPLPGGGALVLDREHRTLWEVDRRLLVVSRRAVGAAGVASAFTPGADAPAEGPPAADDAVALPPVWDPLAVEVAADRTAVVLLRDGDRGGLVAFRDGESLGLVDTLPATHDIALVDSAGGARLHAVDPQGDQAYEWILAWDTGAFTATPADPPPYHPMRLYGGKALVTAGGVAHHDLADRFVPLPRQPLVRYAPDATVTTGTFDGDEDGCVWHRLLIDGGFPPESAIEVWSAAGDDRAALERAPDWQREPDPRPRAGGPELPFVALGERMGTIETLFQRATGRYLRLRLRLAGNGRTTPRLRAVRVWYPRFSYLRRYLPAAYAEDPGSASFLDRFLANPEGILTSIEDRIAAAYALFDPRITPPGALDWLASWFALALDPAWDVARRRLLLRHAMWFFAYRGTIRGLRTALALAFDPCVDAAVFTEGPSELHGVRIVESYRTRGGVRPLWTPADGAEALHRLWTAEIGGSDERFPLAPPTDTARWAEFSRRVLGFVPRIDATARARWHALLAARYTGTAARTELPDAVPDDEPALTDWWQLQRVLLPAGHTAHRFRVLLPASVSGSGQDDDRRRQLELARRVADLEKPAHTGFDVGFYWDAFRVGEARLGLDTIADLGSRAPGLLTGAVLGAAHLGAAVLEPRTAGGAR